MSSFFEQELGRLFGDEKRPRASIRSVGLDFFCGREYSINDICR